MCIWTNYLLLLLPRQMIWTGLPSQLLLLHLHQLFILRRRPFSEVVRGLRVTDLPAGARVQHMSPHRKTHIFIFTSNIILLPPGCRSGYRSLFCPPWIAFFQTRVSNHRPLLKKKKKKKPAMFKDTQQLAATNEELATHSRSLAVSPSFGSMKPRSGESSSRTRPVCVCVHINQSVSYSEHGVWS